MFCRLRSAVSPLQTARLYLAAVVTSAAPPQSVGAIEAAISQARAIGRGRVGTLGSAKVKPPAVPVLIPILILPLPLTVLAVLALRQARHHRLAAGVVRAGTRAVRVTSMVI